VALTAAADAMAPAPALVLSYPVLEGLMHVNRVNEQGLMGCWAVIRLC
jgi:hypothetical protein